MTEKDILKVIELEPSLTGFGFGSYGDWHPEDAEKGEFELARDFLLQHSDRCALICEWLSDIERTSPRVGRQWSYGLKHVIEKSLPSLYCSNGEVICSAIHLGFEYRKEKMNAYFNMSEKSVEAKRVESNHN